MNVTNVSAVLEMAKFGNQAIDMLTSVGENGGHGIDFASIFESKTASGLMNGRNLGLRDPESGYQMMSKINSLDVTFKAQFAELSALGGSVEHMEDVGRNLSELAPESSNAEIREQLNGFVTQYNAWIDRFSPTVADGGVLDDVRAAEISLYELEQSVSSLFHGANADVGGLKDLGIQIDPLSKHIRLDVGQLDAMLARNKTGVISAIDDFSAHFAKSADMLNEPDNFIPSYLDNHSRAIAFIANNRGSLQAEFGTGEVAKPVSQVAQALSAYERMAVLG